MQSKIRAKKLCMRDYRISGELDEISKNIKEKSEIVQSLKKQSNLSYLFILY